MRTLCVGLPLMHECFARRVRSVPSSVRPSSSIAHLSPAVGTMLRSSLLVALLSPSAAFHLGQHRAPRPTSPRLSPVVAAAEKHATVIFLRHG